MNEIGSWMTVIAVVSIGIPALIALANIVDELRRIRAMLDSVSDQYAN